MHSRAVRLAHLTLAILGWGSLVAPLHAGAPIVKTGPVTLDYGSIQLSSSSMELGKGVAFKSEVFDLTGEKMTVTMASGKDKPRVLGGISRASAIGDLAKGIQVTGRFEQKAEGQTIRILADQAVYMPDLDRPKGGKIEFTGHVKMILSAPLALAEPSVTETDHLTVLLGPAPEYPRVEGPRGHMTLTPLN